MLKGHLSRVVYHQVYQYTKITRKQCYAYLDGKDPIPLERALRVAFSMEIFTAETYSATAYPCFPRPVKDHQLPALERSGSSAPPPPLLGPVKCALILLFRPEDRF